MSRDDEYFLEKLEEATIFMVKESVPIEERIEGFALALSPLIGKRYQHSNSEINDLWNPIMNELVADGEIMISLRAKKVLEPKKLNEMEKAIFELAKTARAFKEENGE